MVFYPISPNQTIRALGWIDKKLPSLISCTNSAMLVHLSQYKVTKIIRKQYMKRESLQDHPRLAISEWCYFHCHRCRKTIKTTDLYQWLCTRISITQPKRKFSPKTQKTVRLSQELIKPVIVLQKHWTSTNMALQKTIWSKNRENK